jgi:hypothetical protein
MALTKNAHPPALSTAIHEQVIGNSVEIAPRILAALGSTGLQPEKMEKSRTNGLTFTAGGCDLTSRRAYGQNGMSPNCATNL